MDTIHQGYSYSVSAGYDDGTYAGVLSARLFSPSTERYVEMAKEEDGSDVVFTLSADTTAEMPVGNYNLEIYLDSAVVKHFENYVRVVSSSQTPESQEITE